MVTESRSVGSWPERTATTPRCSLRSWTCWTNLRPLPDDVTVHLDAGYDSDRTRTELGARSLHGRIAHKGEKAPNPGEPALACRAHPRLAERLPPARPLLRTPPP